jgi:TRAP-type mannitol/chloroaromatic compound transport system permease small subunit
MRASPLLDRRYSPLRTLLKLSAIIDAVSELFGQLANWIVLITIAIGFYNVAVRFTGRWTGLQLSSNVYIELQQYLFSLIFLLGFAYILKHGINVRVDFLYTHWSDRTRAAVDLVGTLAFLIPFCIIGIYVTINPVLTSWGRLPDGTWGSWEMSPDANGLPRAPIKSMIIVAFALLLMQAISQTIKYLAVVLGHQEIEAVIKAETSENLLVQ